MKLFTVEVFMKKILLLTTGGTIASKITEEGLAPSADQNQFLHMIQSIISSYSVSTKSILNLDSSNIQPEEWNLIAEEIAADYPYYDGIVLSHGTDTMAYTAAALSYCLRNIPIPVVLTGSQLPIYHPLTDGIENLRSAFAMAAEGPAGIYLAFNRKIILGTRAVKVRTTAFNAFESVNCPFAGIIDSNGLTINRAVLPKMKGNFSLENHINSNVFLLKLVPGLNPQIFDMLLQMNYKGIVIEAFGSGGMHFIRRDLITKLQKIVDNHVPVVVCSQCLYEKSDFSIYQTGKLALKSGVIQGYDMTTEAAVTKLMWLLGKTNNMEQIAKQFHTSYCGEITL